MSVKFATVRATHKPNSVSD